jgi:DNA-cytosine methyltransferase
VEPTHASFFSGVGGLDLGLERAGWRTVSFSEIDSYASAVLAERWPGVPNLGDIVQLAEGRWRRHDDAGVASGRDGGVGDLPLDSCHASLWTGGFPCQDLSVAGKRRGLAGSRSGLAYAFLDLVERHRPPAVLLENVPGLLSSHGGRDLGALAGTLGQLGYGWAYRVLDARHFGVPQRRRRVFILGIHARVDPSGQRAAEVLSVGSRCGRHPPAGVEAGPGTATRFDDGVGGASPTRAFTISGNDEEAGYGPLLLSPAVTAKWSKGSGGPAGHEEGNLTIVGPSPDADRDGAPDGLAGRLDDSEWVVNALDQRRGGADDNEAQAGHLVYGFSENQRGEVVTHDQAHQLTSGGGKPGQGYSAVLGTTGVAATDDGLPLGLDSHRYRCCGNGVVSSVAEWIGRRLLEAVA